MPTKTSFKNLNLLNERRWTAFCLKFPEHAFEIPLDNILNDSLRLIIKAIQKVFEAGLKVTPEDVVHFLAKDGIIIEIYVIKDLIDLFINFDNIEYVKTTIKNNYINNNVNLSILEDLLVETTAAGELDPTKLKNLAETLLKNLSEVKDNQNSYTAEELEMYYKQILKDREKGIKKRSFGYEVLNKHIIRGAAEGELTFLLSQKGVGKSTFALNMMNQLLIEKVPVIYFSLEMSRETTLDRFMCLRMSCSLNELYRKEKDERLKTRVDRYLAVFGKHDNYLHEDIPCLSVNDIDARLYKNKKRFKDSGVFLNEKDEYMFVIIDLATMIEDISGKDIIAVNNAVDKLHVLARKYNSHFLLIGQANENKLRGARSRLETPEAVDRYIISEEDIKGNSTWAERGRLIFTLTRPLQMKKKYFPDREDEWNLEEDIMWLHCIKNNNGPSFRIPFTFIGENFSIMPRKPKNEQEQNY